METHDSTRLGNSWADGYALLGDRVLVGAEIIEALGSDPLAGTRSLGGSFAAALNDGRRTVIVSDRFGSRPVFYARSGETWTVGLDPWEVARSVPARLLDPTAAVELLAYKYVLGDDTVIPGVREVPPGSVAVLSHEGESVQRYWRYSPEPVSRSGGSLVRELGDVLKLMSRNGVAVGERIGLDRWGVNLTAGRDSRVILAGLAAHGADFECFSSEIGEDAAVAQELAEALGVHHHRVPAWRTAGSPWIPALADPLAATTMAAVAGHPLALAASGDWPISGWVSGHLGDNFVGGQLSLRLHAFQGRPRAALVDYVTRYHRALPAGELRLLLREPYRELADEPDAKFRRICNEVETSDPFHMMLQVDLEQRKRRHILRDHLALRQLGPTMLWFADPAWADFWATVPSHWQIGTPLYGRALRERVFVGQLRPLAEVPTNGSVLRSVRFPRAVARREDVVRRARKRLGSSTVHGDAQLGRLDRDDLDAASWLIDPDYFGTERPVGLVEAARTVARATRLLEGA